MAETPENRLKRMKMRAWHRGMKEMDIILGNFADASLNVMSGEELDDLDALMEENDQDLYQWVTGQVPTPAQFVTLVERIAQHAGAR
ncbi:FAD assembly factor SdhE [Actibacterium lipolyticum]|uniref:FAD assembly factor SdhE n=1 Tax=Actibacterium lipolyticum TaxID=1524263 RepID=A0A238JQZ5_9RHOB|nr:succinate dehydrogenase assembly factor 2 [Actibacterium lipolyticum]SMX32883.1 Flavinator of succinate dehydrogenase [Actibacterium lipolyticum]